MAVLRANVPTLGLPAPNRFGTCRAEICRDHVTGDSLNYAFVEFEAIESCEEVSLSVFWVYLYLLALERQFSITSDFR